MIDFQCEKKTKFIHFQFITQRSRVQIPSSLQNVNL
nr:MAG TPA: hypothetical protein [Caudoviricetes sp.]